jgi:hypothetical protein
MNDPAKPSQDAKLKIFDLEEHQARRLPLSFAAEAFFSNNGAWLERRMKEVRQSYPEGKVPVPA